MPTLSDIKKDISDIFAGMNSGLFMRLFALWLAFEVAMAVGWVFYGNQDNKVIGLSTVACGVLAILFWMFRHEAIGILEFLKGKPFLKFMIVGGIGALFAELLFWAVQQAYSASGIAANANLGIDYALTMPWYLIMLVLLYFCCTRYDYSFKEMLIFGGIYEFGADAIFGALFKGNLAQGMLYGLIGFPLFVVVYSIIVVPAVYVLKDEQEKNPVVKKPEKGKWINKYAFALLPLLGLLYYAGLYLFFASV